MYSCSISQYQLITNCPIFHRVEGCNGNEQSGHESSKQSCKMKLTKKRDEPTKQNPSPSIQVSKTGTTKSQIELSTVPVHKSKKRAKAIATHKHKLKTKKVNKSKSTISRGVNSQTNKVNTSKDSATITGKLKANKVNKLDHGLSGSCLHEKKHRSNNAEDNISMLKVEEDAAYLKQGYYLFGTACQKCGKKFVKHLVGNRTEVTITREKSVPV